MQKKVIIIGAGGHGRVLRDMVERSGVVFLGFLDDSAAGTDILGKTADAAQFPEAEFIIGIGDNAILVATADSLGTMLDGIPVVTDDLACHLNNLVLIFPTTDVAVECALLDPVCLQQRSLCAGTGDDDVSIGDSIPERCCKR